MVGLHESVEKRRMEAWVNMYLNSFGLLQGAATQMIIFAFAASLHHCLTPPQSAGGDVWDGLYVQLLVRRHTLPKGIHSAMLPLHNLNGFNLPISISLKELQLPHILKGRFELLHSS